MIRDDPVGEKEQLLNPVGESLPQPSPRVGPERLHTACTAPNNPSRLIRGDVWAADDCRATLMD